MVVNKEDEGLLKGWMRNLGPLRLGYFFRPFQQEPLDSAGEFRGETDFREIYTIIEQEKALRLLVLAGCLHVELRLEYELSEAYRAGNRTKRFLESEFYGNGRERSTRALVESKDLDYWRNDDDFKGLLPYSFGQKLALLTATAFSTSVSGARKAGLSFSSKLGRPMVDQRGPVSQTIAMLAADLHYVAALRNEVCHNKVLWENKWEKAAPMKKLKSLSYIHEVSSSMGAINNLIKVLDQMDQDTYTDLAGEIISPIRDIIGDTGLFVAGLENGATEYLIASEAKENIASVELVRHDSFTELPSNLESMQSFEDDRQQ